MELWKSLNHLKYFCLAAALILQMFLAASVLAAQTELSLNDSIAQALKNNPKIKIAANDRDES